MEAAGFGVRVIEHQTLKTVRASLRTPASLRGCHVGAYLDYFLEGHVSPAALPVLAMQRPEGLGLATESSTGAGVSHVRIADDERSTIGRPVVKAVIANGLDETELLRNAASVEHYSQHPLARAIVAAAEERSIMRDPAHTEPLMIAAYNVPNVTAAGPRNIFVGDPGRFVVEGEEEAEEGLVVEWSEDRGETWLPAGREYTFTARQTVVSIFGCEPASRTRRKGIRSDIG